MRVLKWNVPVDDMDHPIGAGPVALVACQDTPNVVQVWTVESGGQVPIRAARVFGTGHETPDDWRHLGSCLTLGGQLVWHVFGSPHAH